jgi:hypothetical protein
MEAQYQPQKQNMPQGQQKQQIEVRIRASGRGSGGGGDGPEGPGPEGEKEFTRQQIAQLLRSLANASDAFLSNDQHVNMDQGAVRDLLVGGFNVLADATLKGKLPDLVARIEKRAADSKRSILSTMPQLQFRTELEMGQFLATGVVTQIKGCLDPEVPK